jgi:hypothetical protein
MHAAHSVITQHRTVTPTMNSVSACSCLMPLYCAYALPRVKRKKYATIEHVPCYTPENRRLPVAEFPSHCRISVDTHVYCVIPSKGGRAGIDCIYQYHARPG